MKKKNTIFMATAALTLVAFLVGEIGTFNKTSRSDYEDFINESGKIFYPLPDDERNKKFLYRFFDPLAPINIPFKFESVIFVFTLFGKFGQGQTQFL